jgi:hypothetical protein
VVIGTDCIGSCKFNYHTITTNDGPLDILCSFNLYKPNIKLVPRRMFRLVSPKEDLFRQVSPKEDLFRQVSPKEDLFRQVSPKEDLFRQVSL